MATPKGQPTHPRTRVRRQGDHFIGCVTQHRLYHHLIPEPCDHLCQEHQPKMEDVMRGLIRTGLANASRAGTLEWE